MRNRDRIGFAAAVASVTFMLGAAGNLIAQDGNPQGNGRLRIQEADGSPSGGLRTLNVTNGDLTDNGDGSFTIATASAVAAPTLASVLAAGATTGGTALQVSSGDSITAPASVDLRLLAPTGQVVDVVGDTLVWHASEAAGDYVQLSHDATDAAVTAGSGRLTLAGASGSTVDALQDLVVWHATLAAGDTVTISHDATDGLVTTGSGLLQLDSATGELLIDDWLNVNATSAVAAGDVAASDGTRTLFYDASGAQLQLNGAAHTILSGTGDLTIDASTNGGEVLIPGTGATSTQIGPNANASATNSTALGSAAQATASAAFAAGGNSANCSGAWGIALGDNSRCLAASSVALGRQADVANSAHTGSLALGYDATTTAANEAVFGSSTSPINSMGWVSNTDGDRVSFVASGAGDVTQSVSGDLTLDAGGGQVFIAAGDQLSVPSGDLDIQSVSGSFIELIGNVHVRHVDNGANDFATFAVDSGADLTISATGTSTSFIRFDCGSAEAIYLDDDDPFRNDSNDWVINTGTNTGLQLASDNGIHFSSTTAANGTADVGLDRDSAGILAITDGSTGDGQLGWTVADVTQAAGLVTLTDASATQVASLTMADGTWAGGTITYTIEATDGTEYQAISGRVGFAIVDDAGGVVADIQEETLSSAVSSGTLTDTWTITTTDDQDIEINCNADTSLTSTTLRVRLHITLTSAQAITIP